MHEKVDVIVPLRSMSRSASEARVVGSVRFVLHLSPLYSISLAQKIHEHGEGSNVMYYYFAPRASTEPDLLGCGKNDIHLLHGDNNLGLSVKGFNTPVFLDNAHNKAPYVKG
ncbi:hypothetical protein EVAR_92750_1 [Eumeta japonica]|uniref:Uncharacterized protein n=1 Tax=Eumeta variegata TaxID=151549 RepID=A0A4C1T0Q6_EUMVA|nr:hypothetical protein EVAR_92750_1 [Eumeta japonica]